MKVDTERNFLSKNKCCFMYNPFILYSLYAYKFLIKLDFLKFQFSYKTIYKNFWDDDIIVQ